jgi:hypothetical protein
LFVVEYCIKKNSVGDACIYIAIDILIKYIRHIVYIIEYKKATILVEEIRGHPVVDQVGVMVEFPMDARRLMTIQIDVIHQLSNELESRGLESVYLLMKIPVMKSIRKQGTLKLIILSVHPSRKDYSFME